MLQQTTVAAVIGYYQRFLQHFPTLESLATASLEEVIDLWSGLGYYSRARNLHAAAGLVVEKFAGIFPAEVAELMQLPGIGRSTAGAISALAFDRRAPILDGNVRRVLCRLYALQEPPRSARAEKLLWSWAEELTPQANIHDYTQAIMDLGATICTPRQPQCDDCPVMMLCRAHQLDLVEQLPLRQKRKSLPLRREAVLLINSGGRYPARRRPAEGFLGGLWEFPHVSLTDGEDAPTKLTFLLHELGFVGELEQLGKTEHFYSHFRLRSEIYRVTVASQFMVAEENYVWFTPPALETLSLHGAHKKILATERKSSFSEAGN